MILIALGTKVLRRIFPYKRYDQLISKTQLPNGTDIYIGSIFCALCPPSTPPQVHLAIKFFHLFSRFLSLRSLTSNNIQQIIIIKRIVFRGDGGIHPARVCIWTYWKIILEYGNRDRQMLESIACLTAIVLRPDVMAGQTRTRMTWTAEINRLQPWSVFIVCRIIMSL
jgi:hypothetical protein